MAARGAVAFARGHRRSGARRALLDTNLFINVSLSSNPTSSTGIVLGAALARLLTLLFTGGSRTQSTARCPNVRTWPPASRSRCPK
jgi:hypothetical protein